MFTRLLSLPFLLAVIVGALNIQTILDWWTLQSYVPNNQVESLASKASFSKGGRQLFYISRPEVNTKETFAQNCPALERGSVLGCYTGNRIYLLEPGRAELESIKEVTAAHEMLHAAYTRLLFNERQRVDDLLLDQYQHVKNQRVLDLLEEYKKTDPAVFNNELHSILPTQIESLSSELEEYYSQYFINRKAVVEAYQSYEAIFADIQSQLTSIEAQINATRQQIIYFREEINLSESEIKAMQTQMETQQQSGNTEAYNAMVPQYNQKVREYRNLVSQHNALVDQLNGLVEDYNQLALHEKNLVESLDSTKISPL